MLVRMNNSAISGGTKSFYEVIDSVETNKLYEFKLGFIPSCICYLIYTNDNKYNEGVFDIEDNRYIVVWKNNGHQATEVYQTIPKTIPSAGEGVGLVDTTFYYRTGEGSGSMSTGKLIVMATE